MDEPRILHKPALTFVGLETSFIHIRSPEANGFQVIGPLWERFLPRSSEIADRSGDALYGVIYGRAEAERSHPHELQYIAAALVNDASIIRAKELPPDMVSYQVPPATYAAFLHRGEITKLGETVNHIYDGWLPASAYQHAGVADIELYDDRFCEGLSSEMEYWISIAPKE